MPHSTPGAVIDNEIADSLRRQSQLSSIGKAAIMSNVVAVDTSNDNHSNKETREIRPTSHGLVPSPSIPNGLVPSPSITHGLVPPPTIPHGLVPPIPIPHGRVHQTISNGHGCGSQDAGSHTPSDASVGSTPSTAPGSPHLMPIRQNSGSSTPRTRPPATTLNIPGMTRSRVSPDGRIAERDVASKLVIIMVGLPARGKSYITKKIQRYLSWQQHNSQIFNVGNRRRVAASAQPGSSNLTAQIQARTKALTNTDAVPGTATVSGTMDGPTQAAHILLNGVEPSQNQESASRDHEEPKAPMEPFDQSAEFFDPSNARASQVREQVAISTLDELLDYLLLQGGSAGILDATNSTLERRKLLFNRVKERDSKLGILFIESICEDQGLLEANMRLKLSGPDYKGKDPVTSLEDFRKRVAAYESAYVPLGEYEEKNGIQYIKMIDVGRKVIHHQLKGFLSGGIASYLTTFNLSPRQIWITRHGESYDNREGKLGGNSDITPEGRAYGAVLYNFMTQKRKDWLVEQKDKILSSSFPPQPGDNTPPYPESRLGELDEKNFCIWTSMLKRCIQTAEDFEADDDYDVKNWEMLNELNAGDFERLTYEEIEHNFPLEFNKRKQDKLHYIYPGVGGEGYLQVISRLRDMVREIERITDHVLIIGHRSIARVLMAYFMDLTRNDIADLDVPLGMLFVIEPKPYGVDFHPYKYNEESQWFDEVKDYKPHKETRKGN
ncbi:hypothetical protein VC83_00896 [Pseudogymnoascus destructans]|uniref:6-phosphofructo-2-kinase domain-containing protein n=2 Tax=Pseudogymnoascus destructans TaxID=655981 RepID=L8FPR5_PSED2|nr:uncharacterized protein VC83_00896 [Pseudogymnoascus destructans]ELR01671.1 hypothetical protein GMDG_00047 [Pseudogymnoascus destructans 20631-21]OAF62810.1 hypothetical protein VC83_00896 [Pseudogymnoascus destructans]